MNRSLDILIVEDNPDASHMLKTALEIQGHRVATAADAIEALEEARIRTPDVAVIDIGLPGVDGRGLARLFRTDPLHWNMSLVALSGCSGKEEIAHSLQAGFDAHVAKPVTTVYLLEVIRKVAATRLAGSAGLPVPASSVFVPPASVPVAATALLSH